MNSTFLNFYFKYANSFQTQLGLEEENEFFKKKSEKTVINLQNM